MDKAITKANPITGYTPAMTVAIFKRQYPANVPEAELIKAGLICATYGLSPYLNQVYIIPFRTKDAGEKWVTVIGIKGLREIAQNTGHRYSYVDGPRIMTEQEECEIYGAMDPAYFRAIIKLKNREGDVFPGYGNWRKADQPYGQDKGNTAHNMAFIRAERNALDRMAPGALPDAELVDASFIDQPMTKIVEQGKVELHQMVEKDIAELWPETGSTPNPAASVVIDMEWLKESLVKLKWSDVLVWIADTFYINQLSVTRAVAAMNAEQKRQFVAEVERRLKEVSQ